MAQLEAVISTSVTMNTISCTYRYMILAYAKLASKNLAINVSILYASKEKFCRRANVSPVRPNMLLFWTVNASIAHQTKLLTLLATTVNAHLDIGYNHPVTNVSKSMILR